MRKSFSTLSIARRHPVLFAKLSNKYTCQKKCADGCARQRVEAWKAYNKDV